MLLTRTEGVTVVDDRVLRLTANCAHDPRNAQFGGNSADLGLQQGVEQETEEVKPGWVLQDVPDKLAEIVLWDTRSDTIALVSLWQGSCMQNTHRAELSFLERDQGSHILR